MNILDTFKVEALPDSAKAFRKEVRAFLTDTMADKPVDERAHSWIEFNADFSRKLAKQGWVGLLLPKQYGGAEASTWLRFVLVEEILLAGAPVAAHWIAERQSAPLILRYGTEAQKNCYIAKICAGEAFFCVGLSEPEAGSDLASIRSRAVKNDKGWVLNGQKIWTTNAHLCNYMIALVRTSGTTDDRQKGLSQFIIDLKAPGVTVRPITDLTGSQHFSEVFFEDLQLADADMVGNEGAGWEQVNSELAFERSGPERIYSSIVLLEAWLEMLKQQNASSTPNEGYYEVVGRLATNLTTLRNMSIAVTAKLARGESPVVEAALVKDLGTEFEQFIPQLIEGFEGADDGTEWTPEFYRALSYVGAMSPSFSLRGGTREILRGMIARGLGLR